MKFSLKSLIWGTLLVAVGVVVTFVMFPKPTEVESAKVILGPLRVTVQEDGKTRIREKYVVSAPVAGRVSRIELKPGDRCYEGTLLAVILPSDPAILDARARAEAEARVQAAEAAKLRAASSEEQAKIDHELNLSKLVRAESLAELARAIDVDPAGLAASVARFNGFARSGRDQDFGRGETISDRYYSDPQVTPNPCLAPIEKPPFYAVKVYPGDLGTKGGVVTDPQGRALDTAGRPIPGLYAAGNCSASMMGETYPGAGGTIGPAMVFGFLAAEHACDGARRPGAT